VTGSSAATRYVRGFFDTTFLQVARNSSWSIGTTAATIGAFFAETVILARYFGRETYGVYLLVIAYPEAVQLFLDFRTREAMTRYLGGSIARDDKPFAVAVVKFLWIVDLVVLLFAFLVVFFTAPFVAPHLTDAPDGAMLMRIYAIAVLLGGLDATAGAILRVFDRFRLSFFTGSGSMLLRLAIIVVFVVAGAGLEGVIWARVIAEVAMTVVMGAAALALLKDALWSERSARLKELRGRLWEIMRFLFHTNLQGSFRAAASKLDVIAVGAIAGPGTAGLYKVGVQFGSAPLLFADPLFSSVYPMFSRARALGAEREIRSVGRKLSLALAAIAVPVTVILVVESQSILVALVGESFADAATAMSIALVGAIPAVLFFWGRPAMLALGDPAAFTRITTVAIVAQFVILFALVGRFGAAGAALGFAAMNIVSAALTVRYLRRKQLV
jgi:O-antigen/teichoic acid export membrane protein